jgi:2-dehydropantoate 2-reductase
MLARAGLRVVLIGRAPHVEAVRRDGLKLDMAGRVETIRTEASTALTSVRGADLVLFCVKSTDTEVVARELAQLLEPHAVVVSLQNGVENTKLIARHVRQAVVPGVVYVATAMTALGTVKHLGRGELTIGRPDAAARDPAFGTVLEDLAELFEGAGVKVTVSGDVMAELWAKLLLNCAWNAISALAQSPYARMVVLSEIRALQQGVVREVIAVARAEGIVLDFNTSMQAVERIAQTMPAQFSSTAQDMARRKHSEIDHLNGFIARRGRELEIPVPLNQALHALVKLVEVGY